MTNLLESNENQGIFVDSQLHLLKEKIVDITRERWDSLFQGLSKKDYEPINWVKWFDNSEEPDESIAEIFEYHIFLQAKNELNLNFQMVNGNYLQAFKALKEKHPIWYNGLRYETELETLCKVYELYIQKN
ncbi:hypothetical protein [Bacillus sp. S/N-304-OC-R1]|uniref:hypothetical protein n=1 Tax=Bacillus sp. S/N-304-OC-R1 TaxID=2758034 RepID=UPI001C8D9D26|nr:hypothetical protein [Bacillus sp. S/N-304-OC-R1]MBY0122181.1 hypothetical protein [Bacillus sp. S/N-304-OC-R1]